MRYTEQLCQTQGRCNKMTGGDDWLILQNETSQIKGHRIQIHLAQETTIIDTVWDYAN